jgi:hypothetical protein
MIFPAETGPSPGGTPGNAPFIFPETLKKDGSDPAVPSFLSALLHKFFRKNSEFSKEFAACPAIKLVLRRIP